MYWKQPETRQTRANFARSKGSLLDLFGGLFPGAPDDPDALNNPKRSCLLETLQRREAARRGWQSASDGVSDEKVQHFCSCNSRLAAAEAAGFKKRAAGVISEMIISLAELGQEQTATGDVLGRRRRRRRGRRRRKEEIGFSLLYLCLWRSAEVDKSGLCSLSPPLTLVLLVLLFF